MFSRLFVLNICQQTPLSIVHLWPGSHLTRRVVFYESFEAVFWLDNGDVKFNWLLAFNDKEKGRAVCLEFVKCSGGSNCKWGAKDQQAGLHLVDCWRLTDLSWTIDGLLFSLQLCTIKSVASCGENSLNSLVLWKTWLAWKGKRCSIVHVFS